MKPNHYHKPSEVVFAGWSFQSDSNGNYTNEAIQTAALVQIASSLSAINSKLDALGYDGIHQLISEGLKELRRKTRSRKKRKPKATKR